MQFQHGDRPSRLHYHLLMIDVRLLIADSGFLYTI